MSDKTWKSFFSKKTNSNTEVDKKKNNFLRFINHPASVLKVFSFILLVLFIVSIFKNISYPLLWADESMTAMGSERVLEYGYPKVHDGKNVFYDLRHSNLKLGIAEKYDAYVGGAGWTQYYFGTIGYKLAGFYDDIYLKTGIYRSTFALAGFLGIFVFAYFMLRFLQDTLSKSVFLFLYIFFSLLSVSLALLMREVRYYSLVILLMNFILGLYCCYRFHKPFKNVYFVGAMAILLCVLFITFAPAYFIIALSIGLSELLIGLSVIYTSNFKNGVIRILPVILSLSISFIIVLPLLSFFKTFEISDAMAKFNGFNKSMYWDNINAAYRYFSKFEMLWLALAMKVLVIVDIKKILNENTAIFRVSNFLSLFFVIYILSISRMPGFLYTRYIINLQPVLSVIIIFDFFLLLKLFMQQSQKIRTIRLISTSLMVTFIVTWSIFRNLDIIKGHIYELNHIYEGPLDHTIRFIKTKYKNPADLIIATNYEETSYMYYLKCKVIGGYVGNNLAEDSAMNPDLISWRTHWGNNSDLFQHFILKNKYYVKSFRVKNTATNTIPEFNSIPELTHSFKTQIPKNNEEAAQIWIKE